MNHAPSPAHIAGLVLCGGHSRRMGRPKLILPFGGETMLARVVRLLGTVVRPVAVIAGIGQPLPQLPAGVLVGRDRHPDRGPLEGLAVGLRLIAAQASGAYVTACDVPLLQPEFVKRMAQLAAGYDVAVPHVGRFDEPLAAVYRTGVLPQIERLLEAGRLRPVELFERVRTRRVKAEELIDVDPELQSLANVNHPAEYQAALAKAGFGT